MELRETCRPGRNLGGDPLSDRLDCESIDLDHMLESLTIGISALTSAVPLIMIAVCSASLFCRSQS